MEKVHFQLESTLPELLDLEQKGLFTRQELRQITLKRTKHESALIKRSGKPEDYLKYAEYEIGLERLRRMRWKRLSEWERCFLLLVRGDRLGHEKPMQVLMGCFVSLFFTLLSHLPSSPPSISHLDPSSHISLPFLPLSSPPRSAPLPELDLSPQPRSISSHSIPRRILYILRRATEKFPTDLRCWLARVDYAKSEGMGKVVVAALTA